ncbi:dienelactone hydrolase family protein [Arenibacter palladensis]|uniref:dienelactone hydrolase family protein n=1 Tax=Arenibacter palladensis TaxID=237373 RepID=UPI0026E27475|nr:dienelactone hydrolase family protein [Arenibacter palladensis]MDO6605649.1 dienelactone hydrolase family protein [Arenibacter palladensis]
MKKTYLFLVLFLVSCPIGLRAQDALNETFLPLKGEEPPQTLEELWKDFDPRKEPLDTEVLYTWEEDGVEMQVLRYRIGVFKGEKAMMAAIYGYPKKGKNLPALVQIHGGGQYADYRAVLTNAKRGYATISIAWAGRVNAPDYIVDPDKVKLFWEGKTQDPDYKVTTDWGEVDGYHAPSRYSKNSFVELPTGSWTLDPVASPRNNSWFLCTVGARRALTFLERQPQVNADKLGVYGHSMGGKLTVLTTGSDSRVKAAAPSCGGISDRYNEDPLFQATLGDHQYLKEIDCPIFFLSPANDFHGRINDLQKALGEIKSKEWRVACSAHHNHQDNGESEVTGLLWFDQHLKGTFSFPKTPESTLQLRTKNGIPTFSVIPDGSKRVREVEVFYTQQGSEDEERENSINRFWHYAKPTLANGVWTAELPLASTDKPLWAYANVVYDIDGPVVGAGYYYRIYAANSFHLSSRMHIAGPQDIQASGSKISLRPTRLIESFNKDWEKEWFTYKPETWERKTHKVYNGVWKAPKTAKLAFEVKVPRANTLVVGIDAYGTEVELPHSTKWQKVVLAPSDFVNAAGETMEDWEGIMELRFGPNDTLRVGGEEPKTKNLGGDWEGEKPRFRNMKWL